MKLNQKTVSIIGRVASFMSICMYVSYIPQIIDNLSGHKGNPIQPAVAILNCLLWTIYGFGLTPKDKPLIYANIPGIILAAICTITAIM